MSRRCGDCRRERLLTDTGLCHPCTRVRRANGAGDPDSQRGKTLTEAEIRYLQLAAKGLRPSEAAACMGITRTDVERLLRHIHGPGRASAGSPALLPDRPAPGYLHPGAPCRTQNPLLFFAPRRTPGREENRTGRDSESALPHLPRHRRLPGVRTEVRHGRRRVGRHGRRGTGRRTGPPRDGAGGGVNHHPLLTSTGRHGCWCVCSCGWRSRDYTTVSGAHYAFGRHLLEVTPCRST
jgi:hypothetical protein